VRSRTRILVAAAVVALFAALATVAIGANAHFISGPTCSQTSTSTLVCSGKVAGLGNSAIFVVVNAPAGCINNGENTPPGHLNFISGPFTTPNGQFTFGPGTGNNVTATAAGCPPGQQPFITTTDVTVSVYECTSGTPTFNKKTGAQTNRNCTLATSAPATIV
jgi:hypothetical protein